MRASPSAGKSAAPTIAATSWQSKVVMLDADDARRGFDLQLLPDLPHRPMDRYGSHLPDDSRTSEESKAFRLRDVSTSKNSSRAGLR